MKMTNVTSIQPSSWIPSTMRQTTRWLLSGFLAVFMTASAWSQILGPNCGGGINSAVGDAPAQMTLPFPPDVAMDMAHAFVWEFTSSFAQAPAYFPLTMSIENEYGGQAQFFVNGVPSSGPTALAAFDDIISVEACRYIGRTLKVSLSNNVGSCWIDWTFKQSNGPIVPDTSVWVWCLDPEVSDIDMYLDRFYGNDDGELEAGEYHPAYIPCRGYSEAEFAADWIVAYDCVPGQDTAKVIYREFEAFDKEGRRGFAFDTIVVLRLPEITVNNIFCAEKDTTYCGVYYGGPFMVVQNHDGATCDTIYFLNEDWTPATFDTKCGLQIHVDKWKFEDACSPQYKVVLDIKQSCYGADQGTVCPVDPIAMGPGNPNAFEEIAEGYWRCEYWVIDLDTIPPYSAVKYDKLQEQNLVPSQYVDDDDPHFDEYHCFYTPISAELAGTGDVMRAHYQPLIVVPTTTHDCAGHTYIPPVCAYDDWAGLKQVKARIIDYHAFYTSGFTQHVDMNIGSFVAEATGEECDFFHDPPIAPDHGYCYEFHDPVKLPKSEYPYVVFYEIMDSCHQIDTIYAYMLVKDRTRPVAVADKGVTVSLGSKKVWVDAETFDEGSWDNCGINFLLARRADWSDELACVNLCDSVDWCCAGPHGDTLRMAFLEPDKHKDEVEAYYAETLEWLWSDGQECASIIYNAWLYDLMKYATLYCADHDYDVDDDYFRHLFEQCYYDYHVTHSNGVGDLEVEKKEFSTFNDIDPGTPVEYCFDRFHYIPDHPGFGCDDMSNGTAMSNENGGSISHKDLAAKIDLYEQIGGGWAKKVPFSCEDACGPVTVEILAMDYWCNWTKAWTKVWVEDKTPPVVAKDVVDGEITCASYKKAAYYYPGEEHPVSLEYLIEKGKEGDQSALDTIDAILGGYCKAWVDPYGNYVDEYGEEIDCDITYQDYQCTCEKIDTQIRVYDDHLGYLWKDSSYTKCYNEYVDVPFYKGIVAVNCPQNVQCEQEIWCDFDHCGQGVIYRKFKIWQGCPPNEEHSSGHYPDTIVRHQRIWVGNNCELDKYMFHVPYDQTVYACGIDYDPDGSGNVVGAAGPEYTGYPEYKFDDDCRIVGIAHEDKVFKIVGGDEGCYKIVRTWYFADWCGGKPVDDLWWKNRDAVYDECVQKILVIDTVPPVCVITGPVADGDTIQAAGCYYDFNATVDVTDSCGLVQYYWELKDITKDPHELVDYYSGELEGGSDNFAIEVEPLLGDGDYKLKVRVTDECQNESYCEYNFTVVTGKKPAPVCITSITVELQPWDLDNDGEVDTAAATVWAAEFDRSSAAPCGYEDDELEFFLELVDPDDTEAPSLGAGDLDSLALGCEHVGSKPVRLWVRAPNGATDYCEVLLIVQNWMGGCGDISAAVAGVITTELDDKVEQVEVVARVTDGAVLSGVTSASGAYSLATSLNVDVTVTPKKTIEADNGVSTLDLVKIQKHILGKASLESDLRLIAADASNDGKITPLDLLEIRKLILGKTDKFANVDSWRFFNKENSEETYTINGINGIMRVDWTGVKIGDVDNSNDPSRSAGRSGKSLVFNVDNAQLIAGNQYKVDFKANNFNDISGYQFTLNFDKNSIKVLNVEPGVLEVDADNFGMNRIEDGMMTTSWNAAEGMSIANDEVVFSLIVEAKNAEELSNIMTVNSRITSAEAYNSADQIHDVSLNFGGDLAETGFALYQNEPNPFKETTQVGFNLPEALSGTVTVYDVTGKVLKVVEGDYTKGYNEVTFKRADLNTTGVLYYQLDTEAFTATKKMIVIE
ncbi:MAG: T9SS type A sorting domain-containing protein [Saprospiraceae bacterium]|nr:T9SS type A sorting domain-containing protein [Saprospiraceae bacterium]